MNPCKRFGVNSLLSGRRQCDGVCARTPRWPVTMWRDRRDGVTRHATDQGGSVRSPGYRTFTRPRSRRALGAP